MKDNLRRTMLVLTALLIVSTSLIAVPVHVTYAAGTPNTIPALREWTDGSGSYIFSASSRIMYNGSGLAGDAATFAEDLKSLTGLTIATVSGSSPATGDIYMTLGATDPIIGNEGYLLTIGSHVVISAKTNDGAFYGTRTMLQLIRQGYTIAAGTARDWPMYKLRGTHVDNGRKYFTPAYLRDMIREHAYLKMNFYHLHMNDREGFRVQLFNHPEVPTSPYLTQAEVADLVALAAKYHVMLVPEIDMPGHDTEMLRNHPELWMNGSNASQMDLSKDGSYMLASDILNELIPLFPAPYWHIGADEYNLGTNQNYVNYAQSHFCPPGTTAVAGDALVGFVNFVNGIVKAHGKKALAWHDVLSVPQSCINIDRDIIIDFWNADPTTEALPGGWFVLNSNRWQTYYVLGGSKTSVTKILNWNPAIFAGATIADSHPQNMGGKGLHIWCDKPNNQTEVQIASNTFDLYRAAGQKTWNSPMLATSFDTLIALVGASPGYGEHLGSPTPTSSGPTNTPTASATPSRTNTPASPTNTPALTNTPSGPTNTPTRTNTPVSGTATNTPISGANLALGKTTTVSSFHISTKTGAAAVDGDTSTFWRTLKGSTLPSEWIIVDLGSSQSISQVTLKWYTVYARNYTIQVSPDNTSWTTVYTVTGENGGIDAITFSAVSARYVKMDSTAWSNNTERVYLQEIEIYH
jgi:hexosaminidase